MNAPRLRAHANKLHVIAHAQDTSTSGATPKNTPQPTTDTVNR